MSKKINGIPSDKLYEAIFLLQEAGIDVSGAVKQLAYLMSLDSIPKKEKCEHNWILDGHNAGDPICSKCYKRE